jgi:hypothetical protein
MSFLHHDNNPLEEALLLSEVWYTDALKVPDALRVQPSQHPKRVEALSLSTVTGPAAVRPMLF